MSSENKQLKILLVDDDRFLLDIYALKFKKSGIDIDALTSASLALQKIKEGATYDILILDIVMPDMDGIELLKIIRKEKLVPKAIVIMLTNQPNDFEKAKTLNIDDYIIKAMSTPSEAIDQVLLVYKNKKK